MSQIYDDFTWNFSQTYDYQVNSPVMSPREPNYKLINPNVNNIIQFYDPQEAKRYAKSVHWNGEITCDAKLLSFVRIDKRRYFPPIIIKFSPK